MSEICRNRSNNLIITGSMQHDQNSHCQFFRWSVNNCQPHLAISWFCMNFLSPSAIHDIYAYRFCSCLTVLLLLSCRPWRPHNLWFRLDISYWRRKSQTFLKQHTHGWHWFWKPVSTYRLGQPSSDVGPAQPRLLSQCLTATALCLREAVSQRRSGVLGWIRMWRLAKTQECNGPARWRAGWQI